MHSKHCLEGSKHNDEDRQTSAFLVQEPQQKALCSIAHPRGGQSPTASLSHRAGEAQLIKALSASANIKNCSTRPESCFPTRQEVKLG